MPMSVQICLNSSISIQPRPLMSHLLNSASSRPAITATSTSTPEHQDCTVCSAVTTFLQFIYPDNNFMFPVLFCL